MRRRATDNRRRRPTPPKRGAPRALLGAVLGTFLSIALFFLLSTLFYGVEAWTGEACFLGLPRWLWGPREESVAGAYMVLAVALPIGWVGAMVAMARALLRHPRAGRAGWWALGGIVVAAYAWAYAVSWFVTH